MTFEEWQATRKSVAPVGPAYDVLKNHFGYVPDDVISVYEYSPGVVAALKNGQYFTHIGRSEYTGTLAAVEQRLWDEYTRHVGEQAWMYLYREAMA